MNELLLPCFYLVCTQTGCRLIMKEKPSLMARLLCDAWNRAYRIRRGTETSHHVAYFWSQRSVIFQNIDVCIFTLRPLYLKWCIQQKYVASPLSCPGLRYRYRVEPLVSVAISRSSCGAQGHCLSCAYCVAWWVGIAQSVQRLAGGSTFRGSNSTGGKIFRTRPDQP